MAKDFLALIRLHQWHVDQKKRVLGLLLGRVAKFEFQADDLESEIRNEQEVASELHEGIGFYYGTYAQAAVRRRQDIARSIAEVEVEIVIAQDDVREEYRELKSFELSQEARDLLEEEEQARQEQQVLDEIGLEAYRRRAK